MLATFASARQLRTNAHAGSGGQPLRGKNIALLLGSSPSAHVAPLSNAAQALGARVAELRFTRSQYPVAGRDDIGALARVLGRLYDAVDCEAVESSAAYRIEKEAGIPVYHGLCQDEHPARVAADLMTLHDLHPPPGASILFVGDTDTARASGFISAARAMGFEVLFNGREGPDLKDTTFLVDASDGPHWSLLASTGPVDEGLRAQNHHWVMQTMLLHGIVKGLSAAAGLFERTEP
ncbi:Ornithine carbamoyltransferase chain F [Variovorax sp. PBS-H4]|nr:Ornithine carbamoyltransferase chain F [Variovorax sp. PBS-H4]